MNSPISDLGVWLIKAWQEGTKKTRISIFVSLLFMAIGGATAALFANNGPPSPHQNLAEKIAAICFAIGIALVTGIASLQKTKAVDRREKKIEAVERKAAEHPGEPKAAWELASVKLESYLDRNLLQVQAIFWLTTIVMTAGFFLIGFGIYKAFDSPANAFPSILTTTSGLLVSFIGGTFMVLYKATMSQAKDYVAILERINAVGMSVQILETLTEAPLKQESTAAVANQLLIMYSARSIEKKHK